VFIKDIIKPSLDCAHSRFPVRFPEIWSARMSKPKSSLATHRARMAQQGFVRVEVNVRKEDASLVRHVASALSDPSRQAETRRLLQQRFAAPPQRGLKALLAAAPLDGIDLDRSSAAGRDVDL
jgi:hypothetical protein